MKFGDRLAQVRKDKKITQKTLGEGLGTDGKNVTKAVVSGWEQNQHHPRVDQLALICDKLGCSADYLMFGKVSSGTLSPDVAKMAADLDSLPAPQRATLLELFNNTITMTRSGVNVMVNETGGAAGARANTA